MERERDAAALLDHTLNWPRAAAAGCAGDDGLPGQAPQRWQEWDRWLKERERLLANAAGHPVHQEAFSCDRPDGAALALLREVQRVERVAQRELRSELARVTERLISAARARAARRRYSACPGRGRGPKARPRPLDARR